MFDINHNCDFEGFDLFNVVKNGWKKYSVLLEATCTDFKTWKSQSDFEFGFVPLSNLLAPKSHIVNNISDPIQQHYHVKSTGLPNFLSARIQLQSQLNVDYWEAVLKDYWDQQLVQLLRFGFPLDFNRWCTLRCENKNHASATHFPKDIDAYLQEEMQHNAIIDPFTKNPIEGPHMSPFMTREKPNAPNQRVIIDLSWPKGESVNAGVDKNSYLGAEFSLTFPTVDTITNQLVAIGKVAYIFKVDISPRLRPFSVEME